MSLHELAMFCPPPPEPVEPFSENRIREIRERYGLVLPPEYVEFGKTYGNGAFVADPGPEILIANPFSSYYHREIAYCRHIATGFFETAEGARTLLERCAIEQRALFPLGHDDAVTFIYWVTNRDPNLWRILLIFGEWEDWLEVFDCGLTDFLAGYFTGRLEVKTWAYREVEGRRPEFRFRPANAE